MKLYDNIPEDMKNIPQWVGMKSTSKIPFYHDGTRVRAASVDNSDTWSSFEKITDCVEKHLFDGIGFVFNNNGIVGIDIDKGFDEDGFLSPLAISVMRTCKSFTEYSRSGRGMHVYVKGQLPFDGRNNRDGLEVYQAKRYFIVTGRKLIFGTIIENQPAIDVIVRDYFPETLIAPTIDKKRQPNIYQPKRAVTIGSTIQIDTVYEDVSVGGRNISLTSLAGQLYHQGWSREAITRELMSVNKRHCHPPLDTSEVKSIVKSVMRYKRGS